VLALVAALAGGALAAGRAAAQLSPGPLAAAHAELEGTANCLRCHSSERGVDPERCLACHALLGERIGVGRGLHARADHADCKSCHIEHHGLEFELVWWGEEGIEAFDHSLTGHPLEGAHRRLGCRDCHREALNPRAAELRRAGKDPSRSFLGLGTDCLSCHRDEHRGQFEADRCLGCHDRERWSPAVGFAHERTAFPLTGLHREVACEGRHAAVEAPLDGDPDHLRFVGVAFAECSSCHRDPHAGRFGAGCGECHDTGGWSRIDSAGFDHDLTRYPLEGRHRRLACERCHRPGAPRRGLASEACTDCHRDEHAGQLAGRADGGACESCHSVRGFLPAVYGLEEHDRVFVLEGAHRELACDACHQEVPAAELVAAGLVESGAAGSRSTLTRFRFASTGCIDCNVDPHACSATIAGAALACESCHRSSAWSEIAFDHALAGFALEGAHRELGCALCHHPVAVAGADGARGEPPAIAFDGLTTTCATCHGDPHRGQLADAGGATACARCHATESWIPASGFDHSRDAGFLLEGAHAGVACEGCHRSETDAEGPFVRFRPLAARCSDCHGASSRGGSS
jgi:hypothetical protein